MYRKALLAFSVAIVGLAATLGGISLRSGPDEHPQPSVTSAPAPEASESVAAAETPPQRIETVELRPRDTLVAALRRHGMALAEAHGLAESLRAGQVELRRLRVGDRFHLSRDDEDRVVAVAYAPSAWQRFEAVRADDAWRVERTDIDPEIKLEVRQGEVRNSLWDVVDSGGVAPQVMLDVVQIFESAFDFTADTRPGDRLDVLVEARYANGEYVEDGRILAVQYHSEEQTLTGVGFELDGRTSYYDLEGRSLKRMFLRSPLQFSRISSGFTYRRPHPVLGGVRPHLAIDYAAPTGTPVWAVADGAVEFAGHRGGNGIQVLLRHRAGYKTYYNHLSRVAKGVKAGARVSQKQVIGYVGSTGLSTGPHLDYRVSRNGTFVNPLSEKFLPGEPIPPAQREAFAALASRMVARLQPAVSVEQPASTEPGPAVPSSSLSPQRL